VRVPRAVERSARLTQLVELVPDGAVLADVATDHAWVPIALLASGRATRAIGIDVREAPLAQAMLHASRLRVADKLSLRCGSGLWPLEPGEADTLLIAGVGGPLLAKLIDERDVVALGITRMILQAATEPEAARAMVDQRGWRLDDELLIEERGIHYTTLIVSPAHEAAARMSEDELWLGPLLPTRRPDAFARWCAAQRAELDAILRAIPAGHPDREAHARKLATLERAAPRA
jgi:tRNA (adenine22-N1)-methyltransferase